MRIEARYRWPDGTLDRVDVDTLQSPEWLELHAVQVGHRVPLPLDLVEMGLPAGLEGRVVAIEPCGPIRPGPGRVVLTTVSHLNADVHEVTVEDARGWQETLRPTGAHRFYSLTRGRWIAAGKLERGERLSGLDGHATVVAVRCLPGVQRVYNLSVEGEHAYRVARCGLLVHNNGCGPRDALGRFTSRAGGYTADAARGIAAHKNYRNALGGNYRFEVKLPSGKRVDAVDFKNRVVRELKPDNPRAIQDGRRQLERYRQELEREFGGTWISFLDVYTP